MGVVRASTACHPSPHYPLPKPRNARGGALCEPPPSISHAIPTQLNPTSTQNPQNSNNQTSNHETHSRELHAKLLGGGAWPCFKAQNRATDQRQAPPVWRAPEGAAAVPVGGGGAWPGFETTRRAKLACGDLAGGRALRRPEHPWGNKQQQAGRPPPTGTHSGRARRRPEHQRRHKKHSTGARARRPAPLDATTQTRTLRSTCVRSRSARAARRWRRSSRSPRLRRRAGPHR